jgi:hypothetical protein
VRAYKIRHISFLALIGFFVNCRAGGEITSDVAIDNALLAAPVLMVNQKLGAS